MMPLLPTSTGSRHLVLHGHLITTSEVFFPSCVLFRRQIRSLQLCYHRQPHQSASANVRLATKQQLKCSRTRAAFQRRKNSSQSESGRNNSDLSRDLPLSNLKVLDLSRVLAGPFCTQILADYGATVLKVEQPGLGDETRQWRTSGETEQMWKPDHPLMSLYFCAVNRNKRSMTLNLKSEQGQTLVRDLIATRGFDIVVHNFLPGKMEEMGLGYEELSNVNERLIYAGVSGYGASGPSSKRAGYDAIALAEAGLLHITGDPNGGPSKPGVAIADLCTGLYTHGAILAAVNARNTSGRGCKIETSLFESSLSLLINVGLASLNLDLNKGSDGRRRGNRLGLGHPNLVPYGAYETKNGRLLFVAANNNRQWRLFCERMGLDTTFMEKYNTNDSRVENREHINTILSKRFKEKTLSEWEDEFEGSGLPYGPVNDVVEALEHPQARARKMTIDVAEIEAARDGLVKMIAPPVKFDGIQKNVVRSNPPSLGEHTDDVLSELGYQTEQIKMLKQQGVV